MFLKLTLWGYGLQSPLKIFNAIVTVKIRALKNFNVLYFTEITEETVTAKKLKIAISITLREGGKCF
jgi:hypothetical protein